ncbi:hypothetical protein FACS1894187_22180 [Synergistales bacterium]|nr:hypothetical protein FACS1894187_22180 [Synergistales bacterium]
MRYEYSKTGNWEEYSVKYKEHMERKLNVLDEIMTFFGESTVALMCFEADPLKCHRLFLAQKINERHGIMFENLYPLNDYQGLINFA